MQGLFTAPFAAKAQPAERHPRVAAFGQSQFDYPADSVVVEQGDDLGNLGRGGAVCEHALHQLADLATQRHQRVQARCMADGAGQVHEVDPLQGKQVALRDHAAQALVVHQANMGNVSLGHGHGRVEGAGLGAEVEGFDGHVPFDRGTEVGIDSSDHLAQVTQGEDAHRVTLRIDHHDAADLLLVHRPHGVAQRRVRGADHRVTHGQFTQRGV
ncbi:hypothetical protein D3C79_746280 [compost metagenome]